MAMVRNGYGTKWQWYENDFQYGTKMIFSMVRNGRYEMTVIRTYIVEILLKLFAGS